MNSHLKYITASHCIFVGFADLFGLRLGFVGDAGLTPCIPTVLTLRYSRRQSRPLIFYSETGRTERPSYRSPLLLPKLPESKSILYAQYGSSVTRDEDQ